MTLLTDREIAQLAEFDIFMPYIGEKCRTLDDGTKAISYGLSQAGYDIRLSPEEFLVFDGEIEVTLDPKRADATIPYKAALVHSNGSSFFELPPFSFGLGTSLELISMPNDVMGICQGKSTYGRIGLVANILPIEPGWSGYLTMCLVNPTPFSMRIYANEGICQVLLFRLNSEVKQPYIGQYQNQRKEVTLSLVG
jgi:dCTP deaminase